MPVLRNAWRLVFLLSFAFWQGGFTFYTAIVVPIGTEVLESATDQGFITRRVTRTMNVAGVVCVLLWAVELWLQRLHSKRQVLGWSLWIVLAGGLAVLFVLHARLDHMLVVEDHSVVNPGQFRFWHRAYLWTSTVQWFAGIVLLFLTTGNWSGASGDVRVSSA